MKQITLLLLTILAFNTNAQLKLKDIEKSSGLGYCIITNSLGVQTYTPCSSLSSTVIPTLQQVVTSSPIVTGTLAISPDGSTFHTITDGYIYNYASDGFGSYSYRENDYGTLRDVSTGMHVFDSPTCSFSGDLVLSNFSTNKLTYTDGSFNLKSVTLGSGLSLSSGTLSATNTSSTTVLTASTNITISGSSPNYTISTPTQTTGLQSSLTAGSNITLSTNTISVSSSPTFTNTTLSGTTTVSGQINQTYTTTASSSTVNLASLQANYIAISGTTTIVSFGTLPAGAERTIVFTNSLSITSNTAAIILPNNLSISTSTNDVMVIRSEGSGVWRMISYQRYTDVWITYAPTITGFSVNPTGFAARYVLNGKTCIVSFSSTGNGTSNATTITMTLPFNAAGLDVSALTFCIDNAATTVGTAITTAGSNVCNIYKNGSSSWTASGNKRINGQIIFEIQ